MPIYTNKGYNISYLSLTTVCHNYMFFTQKLVLIALVSIITQYKIDIYKLVKILFSPSLCFSFMHIYKYNNNRRPQNQNRTIYKKMKKKYCLMFVSTRNSSCVLNGVWSLYSKHKTINKNAIMTNIFNYNN